MHFLYQMYYFWLLGNREGWIVVEKESIDSLPIGWTVSAMIYFADEVSSSNLGWPNYVEEKDRISI